MKGSRRRLLVVGVVLALAAGTLTAVVMAAAGSPADWPMYHHDEGHSGLAVDTALSASAAPQLVPLWMNDTGSSAYTSPAIVHDPVLGKTVIYVGNQAGTLSAYDAVSGDRLWATDLPQALQSSPAVVNGVVYVGSSDHYPVRLRRPRRPPAVPLRHRRHRLGLAAGGGPRRRRPGRLCGRYGAQRQRRRTHLGDQRDRPQRRRQLQQALGVRRLRRSQGRVVVAAGLRQRRQRPQAGGGRQLQP